ncbi:MAG: pseudouridine synthase [Lachnospiraceae bacterium]|nr:pseudouridine synthase [Lachnospiraceae bacterium]
MEEIRLNKYIASSGIASRREADKLIEEGKVTVNGVKAECGQKVSEGDVVLVENRPITPMKNLMLYAYNKPAGVTCTKNDAHAELTLDMIPEIPKGVTYAGRLDRDSEGLLILTNDGDLIDNMMRGSAGHEKEYIVTLNRKYDNLFVKSMENGVFLKELGVTTRPALLKPLSDKSFSLIITQGLNRQIRRMCAALGYEVTNLKRVRVLNILLEDLKPGALREITGEEAKKLYKTVGMIYPR